jgi:hypothetical protein
MKNGNESKCLCELVIPSFLPDYQITEKIQILCPLNNVILPAVENCPQWETSSKDPNRATTQNQAMGLGDWYCLTMNYNVSGLEKYIINWGDGTGTEALEGQSKCHFYRNGSYNIQVIAVMGEQLHPKTSFAPIHIYINGTGFGKAWTVPGANADPPSAKIRAFPVIASI